ncbi:MAG TPA: DUF885 family protein [Parvularculaceae bacterium]|nr:DUF885 family protein [Parvularculaceae bacterium]
MRLRTLRHLTAALLTATALVACGKKDAPPAPAEATAASAEDIAAESARLNAWFDAKYEEQLDFSPIRRTFLGEKKDYDKIDDLSEAGEDAQLEWMRAAAAEMKSSFDEHKLSAEAKESWNVWLYQLERAEEAAKFRRSNYIFTQMQGPQASLPQFLIVFHKVDDAADVDAYVARIGGVARGIEQLLERAKAGASAGARPPLFAYEGVIEQSRNVVSGAPFGGAGDSPVWADVKTEIQTLEEAGKIDAAKAEALREAARAALVEKLGPAYAALLAWFEADKENADAVATASASFKTVRLFIRSVSPPIRRRA